MALNMRLMVMRARFAPTQWCSPFPPKPTCGLGSRMISKVNGFSKTSSSKLALRYIITTRCPFLIRTPPSSVSSNAVR
ncbi:Uncharacterised protein [Mycobacteroides abscessus subsp. abscessus]|nr:Uncharacterised protein [Mycobacteroides abscessus subsp. abscessus]